MGKRGKLDFLSEVGDDRLRKLIVEDKLSEMEIARIFQVSTRTVSRGWQRLLRKTKAEITYEKIEDWFDPRTKEYVIPEIERFIEFQKAKNVEWRIQLRFLKRIWLMLEKKRPSMWTLDDVQKVLGNVEKIPTLRKGIFTDGKRNVYELKQAFRRFFESEGDQKTAWLKNVLLRSRRKDLRSGNGGRRTRSRFTPQELKQILEACQNDYERFIVKLHITLKCREGKKTEKFGLIGLNWANVNWEDTFYGFKTVTIDVYESKTGGGTWWRHCPVDLWFKDLSPELKERWIKTGRPKNGKILDLTYNKYREMWERISSKLGVQFQAHDCRRSPAGWLRDLGLSDLALGQYNATSGEALGYTGVGWENPEIYYQRYGKMNPLAIYDKTQRLNLKLFDGLINKILNSQKTPNLKK